MLLLLGINVTELAGTDTAVEATHTGLLVREDTGRRTAAVEAKGLDSGEEESGGNDDDKEEDDNNGDDNSDDEDDNDDNDGEE